MKELKWYCHVIGSASLIDTALAVDGCDESDSDYSAHVTNGVYGDDSRIDSYSGSNVDGESKKDCDGERKYFFFSTPLPSINKSSLLYPSHIFYFKVLMIGSTNKVFFL